METEDRRDGAAFHRTGSNQVDKVRYAPPSSDMPGRVWINREQYLESVEPEIWASTIGGYRPAEIPAQGPLRPHAFRGTSDFPKIIPLTETRRLMAEIDEYSHGGWPGAFQTGEAPNPATICQPASDSGNRPGGRGYGRGGKFHRTRWPVATNQVGQVVDSTFDAPISRKQRFAGGTKPRSGSQDDREKQYFDSTARSMLSFGKSGRPPSRHTTAREE